MASILNPPHDEFALRAARATQQIVDRSGQAAQNAVQFGVSGLGASIAPPSALAMLTERLQTQVGIARNLDSEVQSIARRLGGSGKIDGPGEAVFAGSLAVQLPRINELNDLVDELARSLSSIDAELQRLRDMVG